MKSSQISKLNIENFTGGIPFTARNLSIISKECNSGNETLSTDYEVADLINSCIELYYINSFTKEDKKKKISANLLKQQLKKNLNLNLILKKVLMKSIIILLCF